jgi:hypothetical protein
MGACRPVSCCARAVRIHRTLTCATHPRAGALAASSSSSSAWTSGGSAATRSGATAARRYLPRSCPVRFAPSNPEHERNPAPLANCTAVRQQNWMPDEVPKKLLLPRDSVYSGRLGRARSVRLAISFGRNYLVLCEPRPPAASMDSVGATLIPGRLRGYFPGCRRVGHDGELCCWRRWATQWS